MRWGFLTCVRGTIFILSTLFQSVNISAYLFGAFPNIFHWPLWLYFHWPLGPYFLWPHGLYFYWLQMYEKGSSSCFCSHVHNIYHSLVMFIIFCKALICYNIFKDNAFYVVLKSPCVMYVICIIYGHLLVVCGIERNAGINHAKLATHPLCFQCGYVVCHLIVVWMHQTSLQE